MVTFLGLLAFLQLTVTPAVVFVGSVQTFRLKHILIFAIVVVWWRAVKSLDPVIEGLLYFVCTLPSVLGDFHFSLRLSDLFCSMTARL